MIFNAFQKASISIISVLCILISVFGIINKQSYNSITTDNSAFDNAVLSDYADFEEEEKALNSNAKLFKDIKNNEYVCFSSKALNNLNYIKRKIIKIYLK